MVTLAQHGRTLRRWVDRAVADELDRDDALDALRVDLKSMRSGEHCAHAVHELLAEPRLSELRDRHGRNMRALAVAALVRMGYPWALRVSPEDLELLRIEQQSSRASFLRRCPEFPASFPALSASPQRLDFCRELPRGARPALHFAPS